MYDETRNFGWHKSLEEQQASLKTTVQNLAGISLAETVEIARHDALAQPRAISPDNNDHSHIELGYN